MKKPIFYLILTLITNQNFMALSESYNHSINPHIDVETKNFICAAYDGNTNEIRRLLKTKVININNKYNGLTALIAACQSGHNEIAKLLIEHKFDVNFQLKNGFTALMIASLNGHTETVKTLLKNNAKISAKETNGFTALMMASATKHADIVKIILNQGIKTNSEEFQFALRLAIENNDTEIIDILKRHQ